MKRSILYGILIAGLFMMSVSGWAGVNVDTLTSRLDYQRWIYPQEKLHVMTDREQYAGGDTVWLRAFVADAVTHQPVNASRYVYVELIDQMNKQVNRLKIIDRKGIYKGYIPLDMEMTEGEYTLAAYTMFAEGLGQDFFFKKKIKVRSPYMVDTKLDVKFEADGKKTKLRILYNDLNGEPQKYGQMSYCTDAGAFGGDKWSGAGGRDITLDPRKDGSIIKIRYDDYSKFFRIPSGQSLDYDVTFHPEGGYLLPGEACKLAFKAVDATGRGVNLTGTIYDSMDAEMAHITTLHRGMGVVTFVPQTGKSYYAVVRDVNGTEKRFDMPVVNDTAAVITVDRRGKSYFLTTRGNVPDGAYWALISRGRLLQAADAVTDSTLTVDAGSLPSGVVQALLLDSSGNALSERLFFVRGSGLPVTFGTELSAYAPRRRVNALLCVDDTTLVGGNYAVTVLDRASPMSAGEHGSIMAQMLLQSDLKGYVEDAGWYFDNPDRGKDVALDALMLTQGWRRYDIPAAMRAQYAEAQSDLERGQQIRGIIKTRWRGKPLVNGQIIAIAPKTGYTGTSATDSLGRFYLDGADLPDGTELLFQAVNRKGGYESNFSLEDRIYPVVDRLPDDGDAYANSESADSLDTYREYMRHDGRLTVRLKDITVTAYSKRKETNASVYEALARYTFDSDNFASNQFSRIEDVVYRIPGMRVADGVAVFRNYAVSIYIDGVAWYGVDDNIAESMFGLNNGSRLADVDAAVPFNMIESINFLMPNESVILGSNASRGGALMITLKDGSKLPPQKNWLMQRYIPLGYQKAAEFYAPKYEVNATPDGTDLRTTVYWNPCVELKDGRGEFSFYTNDSAPTIYTVRCQGLTDDGRIIDTTGTITVK